MSTSSMDARGQVEGLEGCLVRMECSAAQAIKMTKARASAKLN